MQLTQEPPLRKVLAVHAGLRELGPPDRVRGARRAAPADAARHRDHSARLRYPLADRPAPGAHGGAATRGNRTQPNPRRPRPPQPQPQPQPSPCSLTELSPRLALALALSPAPSHFRPASAGADVVPQIPQGASTARERRWPGFRRRRPRRAAVSALATIPRARWASGRRALQAGRGVRGGRRDARLAAGAPPELGISGCALEVVVRVIKVKYAV